MFIINSGFLLNKLTHRELCIYTFFNCLFCLNKTTVRILKTINPIPEQIILQVSLSNELIRT